MLRNRFKWFAVVGLAVLVYAAPAAYAVPLATLTSGGTITCGDKFFNNFTYSATGDMPSAYGVNVGCITDLAGNLGHSVPRRLSSICQGVMSPLMH